MKCYRCMSSGLCETVQVLDPKCECCRKHYKTLSPEQLQRIKDAKRKGS